MSSNDSRARASNIAIRVHDVSKHYVMFERPEDRFKQMLVPRLERLIGRPPRRYFRDFAALSGVSFEVGRGETVGIIGRNGSGKSTLLQIICGTLQPTSGSVEVNGRIAALLELGAGFNPEFTGRENVFLNASILGVPRKEMEWRFDDIARFADIGPFLDQPVKTYSSGMYVRLAFATAINVDPDILIVDEALSVGDEAFQRKCFARIEDIKDKGGTILFVSHGAQAIVQLCTRAILVDAGEKLLEGQPKIVVGQYQRLMSLKGDDARVERENILRLGDASNASTLSSEASPTTPEQYESKELLVAEMKSESKIEYGNGSVRIRDARILNASDRHVNIINGGKRYTFEYFVDFRIESKNISFGFLIKTVDGLGLCGYGTGIDNKRTSFIGPNRTVRVRFEWECRLAPGTYFLNAGIGVLNDGEEVVLHRVLDVLMFRVLPEQIPQFTGLVDLSVRPVVELVGSNYSDAANTQA